MPFAPVTSRRVRVSIGPSPPAPAKRYGPDAPKALCVDQLLLVLEFLASFSLPARPDVTGRLPIFALVTGEQF